MSKVEEQPAVTPGGLAAGLMKSWENFIIAAERKPSRNAANVYASGYSECMREMALSMVAGERSPDWEAYTLANFRRGKDRERDIKADLMEMGRNSDPKFEVVGVEERFEIRDRRNRIVITGKVDLRIKIGRRSIPTEIKSWNSNLVAHIQTFDDLLDNQFTQRGAYQLLSYMYASNEEFGFLILDRHGLPLIIPVLLDSKNLERMENFLQKSEVAMDAAEAIRAAGGFNDSPEMAQLLPAYVDDYEKCKRCRYFGHTCNPPTTFAGANIVTNDELLEAIKVSHETKEAHSLYDKAWNIVKAALRGKPLSVAPGYVITGGWQKGKKFIDDAAEEKFKKGVAELENRYTEKTKEGRFILTVSKV